MSVTATAPATEMPSPELPLPGPADVVLADGRIGVIRRMTVDDGLAQHALHDEESLSDPAIDRMEARGHADECEIRGQPLLEEALAGWLTEHGEVFVETRVVHGHPASVLAGVAADADLVLVRHAHDHRPFDHLGGTVRALDSSSPEGGRRSRRATARGLCRPRVGRRSLELIEQRPPTTSRKPNCHDHQHHRASRHRH
jgi:hypothetical protein